MAFIDDTYASREHPFVTLRSPNLADAIVMAFWPTGHAPFEIPDVLMDWASFGAQY